MGFGDLHRHDEFSTFDGFGKPEELAVIAKELGYTCLGITNHGNTNSLVKHYYACRENGIKPILGVEGYMLPKYKEKERGYHLCLFAMSEKGYENINTIQYEGEKQKYYNPIWDFGLLRKYSDGVICTSACIAGYLSQAILKGNIKAAERFIEEAKDIYGDNFYVEIQPYKVDSDGTQEKINVGLIEIARKMKVKCILTSDSHRGRKEDFPTYLKMHEIAKHDIEKITDTYKERYMPTQKEIYKRFCKMHEKDFGKEKVAKLGKQMLKNIEEIESKVDGDLFENFTEDLPVYDESKDSKKTLINLVKNGLKERGVYKKKYIDRAKEELDTIFYLHFEDYFLMVYDYINWAKDRGIFVGPGRGSCCNYIVNYALKITEVDSILFDLEPKRFLMKERKKMPDIDIDFETARRGEVIEYLLDRYKGHSARVCSYGMYRLDNLVNDLAKVCGLPTTGDDVTKEEVKENKATIANIKTFLKKYENEAFYDIDGILASEEAKYYNENYDDIIIHFCKLLNKVRYIGTHAAGVVIAKDNILKRTALRIDSKGDTYTNYDLMDMEEIKVIKFDILGLSTMSEVGECRKVLGIDGFQNYMLTDEKVIDGFSRGDCDGVFQLDKKSVQQLLVDIHTDSFKDVVAATAMNRPGPLSQKMPELYAANKEAKENGEEIEGSYFDEYLGKTYGTIIYQEQIMQMAVDIAGMTWDEAHAITKMKLGVPAFTYYFEKDYPRFEDQFAEGCRKRGIPEDIGRETFKKCYNYSFNEGHSVGYSLISAEQEYYKMHEPTVFWFSKMKYAKDEPSYNKYCINAIKDGAVIFLPHVNYSSPKTRLRKVEKERCLQQGLADIKGVGGKAADVISNERKKNGIFIDFDNFYDRCVFKGSPVNKGVIEKLKESGALEFNKKIYISRVKKYNTALYCRAEKK
jgi:DNA polymerase-3 subunit alpha